MVPTCVAANLEGENSLSGVVVINWALRFFVVLLVSVDIVQAEYVMRGVCGMMERAESGIHTTFPRRPHHCSTRPGEQIEMIYG